MDVSDGLRAYVQHQSVDQLDVVAVSWLIGHLWGRIVSSLVEL